MNNFGESEAKDAIRHILRDACEQLQRNRLTYLGLPAEEAFDIKLLAPLLENAICVADKRSTLDETKRSIAAIPLKHKRFEHGDMWKYLSEKYVAEPLVADITYLDFNGGGLKEGDPFANEIYGLRSYFAKHAKYPNRTFVFAWFYMPHDHGKDVYIETCKKIVPEMDMKLLRQSTGMWSRTIAVRLLLRQSLLEHGMTANVIQHALYKKSMNTIIIAFSKGDDTIAKIKLSHPDHLLQAPVVAYDAGKAVPRLVTVPGL
jgi:hypothetical protein